MQTTADRDKTKKKKWPGILLLLIIIAVFFACAYYWIFIHTPENNGITEPLYGQLETDATGNNTIGSIPENLAAGGFMASQDGWFYFANFADNASLYMCRDGGEKMVKITDFPVANINVIADSVVFTGLEQCIAARPDGVYNIKFENHRDLLRDVEYSQHVMYGGRLYAINGLRSGGKPELAVIDGDNVYFSPALTKDGLFAVRQGLSASGGNQVSVGAYESTNDIEASITPLNAGNTEPDSAMGEPGEAEEAEEVILFESRGTGLKFLEAPPVSYERYGGGPSVLTEKMSAMASAVTHDGEIITKLYVKGSTMFAELRRFSGSGDLSRILKIDLGSMMPSGQIAGAKSLYKLDNGFVFQYSDNFIYEMAPDGGIKPISVTPAADMAMSQDGRITAAISQDHTMIISRSQLYNPVEIFIDKIIPYIGIKSQNGWYNYTRPEGRHMPTVSPLWLFEANGGHYRLAADGTWFYGDAQAEWLNRTPSLAPAAQKDDFEPAEVYIAPWDHVDEENDIGDDDTEPAPDVTEGKPDAAGSPETSLDTAVMLLVKDSSVEGKYSAESIAKLKEYYGAGLDLDAAVDSGAEKLAGYLSRQFGAQPDKDMLKDVLKDWILKAEYKVNGAKITGDSAETPLTITNVVSAQALSAAFENELSKRAAKNPLILLSPKEKQVEWAIGIFMDIAKDPGQYNADGGSIEKNIKMKRIPDIGWVVENTDEMTNFLDNAIN